MNARQKQLRVAGNRLALKPPEGGAHQEGEAHEEERRAWPAIDSAGDVVLR